MILEACAHITLLQECPFYILNSAHLEKISNRIRATRHMFYLVVRQASAHCSLRLASFGTVKSSFAFNSLERQVVQMLHFYHNMWPLLHFHMCFVNVKVVDKVVIIEQIVVECKA